MGVYIPHMDKPKECIECELSCLWVNGSTHCMVDGEELFCDGIPQRHDCPLIEIVTCGECKWFIEQGEGNVGKCKYRTRPILYCLPTDFCSYGERRTDEHNIERD